MRLGIRWRILIPFFILLVLILTSYTILIVGTVRQAEENHAAELLLNSAQLIETQTRANFGAQDIVFSLDDFAKSISEDLGIEVTFLDIQGTLLGSSIPSEQLPPEPLSLPGVSQALTRERGVQVTDESIAAAMILRGEADQPLAILQLQAPKTYFRVDLSRIYAFAFALALFGGLCMLLILVIIRDRSLRPIQALTLIVQQMRRGNFSNLQFPESPHAMGKLSEALGGMAGELRTQINDISVERAKLAAILDQMTDGVLIADEDGRVQLLNPAAERLFNIDEEKGQGRSVVEVLRYHQLVDLWRKAKDGERQSTMLEIGPQHLFLQVIGIPLKTSLPGSTMILFQDLTQLRRLETVRRDFISNVSHELRTPLASLKALAETLQEGALDDPPVAQRFIRLMEIEIDNLTPLVQELLELSRIESGKVPLSFHRVQPCDLLKPAYERMGLQAERAGLEINLDCQPDLPDVFADPNRITQVLINLIHNSIKFTPQGGKITLSAYAEGDHIVFLVRDTGVGIARKDLGRIFERFYKVDRARTSGGTGLGLSIARHMIEAHGGYIWAESEAEVGSTFYFSLPIA